ncbi:MAG: cyclic nucleotide-binding domain-containing protein [Betaproteobacteria bacterium]|nr:cyclic nucleotide-binding domain-containing protein [Betaproteobacteria bacterium]
MRKIAVSTGIFWIEVPEADLRVLCGCPVDSVKHLLRRGLIVPIEVKGVASETGPNAILLSDLPIQNGRLCSHSEFPVLQMLYMQGMIVPGHPNNVGLRPMLIGARGQVDAQMSYIYRGNYGLVSADELAAAGIEREQADELMRIKLAFAFGVIRSTEELLQAVYVENAPAEIRNGVFVRRLRTNVFEFSFAGEHVEVDLNLAQEQIFECPYTLDMHLLDREYFAVVHTGDGDGWDMNRPTMGSILLHQGHVYVVDAGPNIDYALTALGIGINEIDGIFHTHGHDDHLAGLTSLTRGDRRIAYYAAPMVRASVFKKLAAAMQFSERDLDELFDIRDLRIDEWNDIEGLEVRPIISPHPVETTVFYFRVKWEGGYRSYAHLADIASVRVMRNMLAADGARAGINPAWMTRTIEAYREKADIKKIDIGGGLIHGEAEDFRGDPSGKLILAHTSRRLTEKERTIGSGAPFGTVDVLIKGVSDVFRRRAFEFLRDYFPDVPLHRLRHLMNCEIVVCNPEVLLIRSGQAVDNVYLVLSGTVEMLRHGVAGASQLSAGSVIGETPALLGTECGETYRAVSFVRALRLPVDLYRDFAMHSTLYPQIFQSRDKREDLRRAWLFADGVSCVTLNRLVNAADHAHFSQDEVVGLPEREVLILRSGHAQHISASHQVEPLAASNHFGGLELSPGAGRGASVRFLELAQAYRLPLELVAELPVVRWKLIETHRRRYRGR